MKIYVFKQQKSRRLAAHPAVSARRGWQASWTETSDERSGVEETSDVQPSTYAPGRRTRIDVPVPIGASDRAEGPVLQRCTRSQRDARTRVSLQVNRQSLARILERLPRTSSNSRCCGSTPIASWRNKKKRRIETGRRARKPTCRMYACRDLGIRSRKASSPAVARQPAYRVTALLRKRQKLYPSKTRPETQRDRQPQAAVARRSRPRLARRSLRQTRTFSAAASGEFEYDHRFLVTERSSPRSTTPRGPRRR